MRGRRVTELNRGRSSGPAKWPDGRLALTDMSRISRGLHRQVGWCCFVFMLPSRQASYRCCGCSLRLVDTASFNDGGLGRGGLVTSEASNGRIERCARHLIRSEPCFRRGQGQGRAHCLNGQDDGGSWGRGALRGEFRAVHGDGGGFWIWEHEAGRLTRGGSNLD
jgi:hypothetical protein